MRAFQKTGAGWRAALFSMACAWTPAQAYTVSEINNDIARARISDISQASLSDIDAWARNTRQVIERQEVQAAINRTIRQGWIEEVARGYESKEGGTCKGLDYRKNLVSRSAGLFKDQELSSLQLVELTKALKDCLRERKDQTVEANAEVAADILQIVSDFSHYGQTLCEWHKPCGKTAVARREMATGNAILDVLYDLTKAADPQVRTPEIAPMVRAVLASQALSELWRDQIWPLFDRVKISYRGDCAKLVRQHKQDEVYLQMVHARMALNNTGVCLMN